jgi:hypothetical protein
MRFLRAWDTQITMTNIVSALVHTKIAIRLAMPFLESFHSIISGYV